ncbi:MAG: hypothetical protein AB1758_20060 [Candidatus Eremiobacterota bacterium]
MRAALVSLLVLWLLGAAAAQERSAVSPEDQQAARALLRELYDAYQARDLNKVMAMIELAVDGSAREFEASGKGKGQDIVDAFRAFHEDLLGHPQFRLEEFNDRFLVFEPQTTDSFVVASPVPVILSDSLDFSDSAGTTMTTARLRLGRFTLKKMDGRLRIAAMDL